IYSSPGCSFDATNAAGGSDWRPPPPVHPVNALALVPPRTKVLESFVKRITGLLPRACIAGDVIPARADFQRWLWPDGGKDSVRITKTGSRTLPRAVRRGAGGRGTPTGLRSGHR